MLAAVTRQLELLDRLAERGATTAPQERARYRIDTMRAEVADASGKVVAKHENRLGVRLSDADKVQLQQYITGCYGSLTSFNILFADEDDQFKGTGE